MTSRASMIAAALCFAACGSKAPAPAHAEDHTEHATAEHGEHGEGAEHENMPPELARFHDTLAPRWHAEKGPKRMADTCNAIEELRSGADAIAKATPPRGAHADTWTAGTRQLVDAVAALGQDCMKENQAPGFEPAFENVHKAFHALLEAAGGMPGEHGEHHEM